MSACLAVIEYAVDSVGTVRRSYFTNGAGFATRPTDSPAHTWVAPRLKQPASLHRDLWGTGGLFGAVTVGYGVCTLLNQDGGLDAWAEFAFDGRLFELWLGEPGAPFPAGWTRVLAASMQSIECSLDLITIRLRDRLDDLAAPVCADTYVGTGYGEGSADVLGERKPRVFGTCWNLPPKLIDRNYQVYQAGLPPGGWQAVAVRVLVNGVDLPPDAAPFDASSAAVKTLAALWSGTPAAGKYWVCPSAGLIRLGSPAEGQVTCVVRTLTADWTSDDLGGKPGSLLAAVAAHMGISADAADVAALDALTPRAVWHGIWLAGQETALEAMSRLANSYGAWFGFDAAGALRMGRITDPAGPPAAEVTRHDVVRGTVKRIVTADPGRGVPVWRVTERFRPNWSPLSTIATSIPPAAAESFRAQDRVRVWEDASVRAQHPRAAEIEINTLTGELSIAQAPVEGGQRLALLKVTRETLQMTVHLRTHTLPACVPGAVVRFSYPRYGWASGPLFVVLSVQTNWEAGTAEVTLWR